MNDPDSTRSERPTDAEQPAQRRSGARHAAPKLSVRDRMQLPVGRALAMTAVPTALLVGSIAPKLAFAADASKTTAAASTASATSASTTGANCTQSSSTTTSGAASSAAKSAAAATPSASASASTAKKQSATKKTTTTTTTSSTSGAAASPSASASATPSASASPSASATASQAGGLTGLLDGLGNLLTGNHAAAATTAAASPTATATPSATSAPRAAAATASATPTAGASATSATASPSASASASSPAASSSASATATPSSTASSPAAGSTASASANPSSSAAAAANKLCDASKLAAPMESLPAGTFPVDPWTLKTSRLELINTQFWGVKTVHTAGGDVRVLKFTAQQVNIDNLDMSAPQDGRKLHVQGGSGTTSTMRGGTVTMYVTSLSGTLSKAEGIPLAWLNVSLTLTPDTLPAWLYDLVGSVPIPLTLELTNATAIQAGQTGGNLTIPGMHLYYTPLS